MQKILLSISHKHVFVTDFHKIWRWTSTFIIVYMYIRTCRPMREIEEQVSYKSSTCHFLINIDYTNKLHIDRKADSHISHIDRVRLRLHLHSNKSSIASVNQHQNHRMDKLASSITFFFCSDLVLFFSLHFSPNRRQHLGGSRVGWWRIGSLKITQAFRSAISRMLLKMCTG